MWRMLFLILVVLGALAVLLAVILGIGVAKVAMVQANDPVSPAIQTTRPAEIFSATIPSTGQASTAPVGSEDQIGNVAKNRAEPIVPVQARIEKPAAYVPGTIVLRAANAKVSARLLSKTPPEGDLTNWSRPEDYASWLFTPPPGRYHLFATHANAAPAASQFAIAMAESKKTPPAMIAKASPTGGELRSEFIGTIELNEKRTTLAVRPWDELAVPSMHLRQLELIPVEPLMTPDDEELALEIMGLTIVDAATGKPFGLLTNLMMLDLATLPPFSIRAETAGPVKSVHFALDKKNEHIESQRPFSIAGDEGGQKYTPWTPTSGRRTLVVTPYPEEGAGGKAGRKRVYYLRIITSPIVLAARDARRQGDTLRLVEEGTPAIVNWTRRQDFLEWAAVLPEGGEYNVELIYACAAEHGGEFTLRAGDSRLTKQVEITGDWNTFVRRDIGKVKLKTGKTSVSLKPNDLDDGKTLMNLREVRLTPALEEDDQLRD